jgi:hypothetical protein
VMSAPRIMATVHDSLGLQLDRIVAAGGFAEFGVGLFRLTALVLPVAAMTLSVTRVGRLTGRGLMAWSRDSVPRRIVAATGAAALIGAVGYVWLPNGDYQPIRPGERGTIGEALEQYRDAPGGRPSFTPQRELMYAPVATVRQEEAARREGRDIESVTPGEDPSQGDPAAQDPNATRQPPTFDEEDGMSWPESGESEDYSSGGGALLDPAPSGPSGSTGTAPAPSGTATQPPPSTTTSPAPPPSDGGTSTTTEPPPPTSTDTTTTPPPTTTTPPPDPTTTAPNTTDSTEIAPVAPESTTTAPDTTTTTPDPTTTTTPVP